MLYPINVHAKDGKMIVSLAFKTEFQAKSLLSLYAHPDTSGVLKVEDDFGHQLVIGCDAIGFMIYVDETKDAELGDYINRKVAKQVAKQNAINKIVTN